MAGSTSNSSCGLWRCVWPAVFAFRPDLIDTVSVIAGTDMQPGKEGGTWLAMNECGRIGALLNIGQKKELNSIDSNTARGAYVVEWVTNPGSMSDIFDDVKLKHGKSRQPFKLVAFDVK